MSLFVRRAAVLATFLCPLFALSDAHAASGAGLPTANEVFRRAKKADHAVEAEIENGLILLLSEEEVERREQEALARAAAQAAAAARAAPSLRASVANDDDDQPAPSRRSRTATRTRRKRPRGALLYRDARVEGEAYRQKYPAWSCSAASLTIALSLLDRKPANQTTEELVIGKLGSNISKKDGLTGKGMDALADVARQTFEVAAKKISSADDVTSEVQAGHRVVLDVKRRTTGGGHYVVVSGPGKKPGTVHVMDPAPDGGHFEWDRSTLKNVLRAGGVAVWNK